MWLNPSVLKFSDPGIELLSVPPALLSTDEALL